MSEPIRLVCNDCDTVHRVKSVTLGKLYRCKKCKAPLVTMTPAVVRCPTCGASSPPAHVDVSRLITCDQCDEAPLMQLEFPPPVVPVREIHASAQARTESDPPSDSIPIATEAETVGAKDAAFDEPVESRSTKSATAEPAPETVNDSPPMDDMALARTGQEDRAVQALKQVMDEVQAPLLDEIERSRASVPHWLVAVIVLFLLPVLGHLVYRSMRAEQQEKSLVATRTELDQTREGLQKEIVRLEQELTRIEHSLQQTLQERELLQRKVAAANQELEQLDAYRKSLVSMNKLVKKWQSIATDNYRLAEALKQRLRALGHNPDTIDIPRESTDSQQ